MDKKNQHFITTHNSYFLLSLIEKTPISDLNIFITYMENYQTRVRKLTPSEISELASEGIDNILQHRYFQGKAMILVECKPDRVLLIDFLLWEFCKHQIQ